MVATAIAWGNPDGRSAVDPVCARQTHSLRVSHLIAARPMSHVCGGVSVTHFRNPITEEQIEDAKRRYNGGNGELMSRIARSLGVRHDWLKCLIDPEHDAKRRSSRRESARKRRNTQLPLAKVIHPEVYCRPVVPHDVLFERHRALSQTQSVSAFLMGDPLPGRSALDRMHRS